MLPITLASFRLFLHVVAAAVWVGGQLVLLGILPVLRGIGPEATNGVARAFNRVAWVAFGVLVVTGIWSLLAVSPGDRGTEWNATLGLKLMMVAATGIAAAIHAGARSRSTIAAAGAIGLLAGLAAVWLGILLSVAPS